MEKLIYYSDVITLKLVQEKCNNCGMCVKVCPHQVFEIIEKKVRMTGKDFCMECGACRRNCPQQAIFLDVEDGCGCAAGIIQGAFNGKTQSCGGLSDEACCN
jgi:ferredoxin